MMMRWAQVVGDVQDIPEAVSQDVAKGKPPGRICLGKISSDNGVACGSRRVCVAEGFRAESEMLDSEPELRVR